MTETWRPVVGFEGQYEVSDLGRVRSLDREYQYTQRNRHAEFIGTRQLKGKILRPSILVSGYPAVKLGRKGGTHTVHILVLRAFVGPCPAGMECRHLNGDESNCTLQNLAWGTPIENALDRKRHGTQPLGERVFGAKLTATDIPIIRAEARLRSHSDIAREYGIGRRAIGKIVNGKNWKHIGG